MQTVWNGATEHKEADTRHCANSIADIEFCVTVIDPTVSLAHLFIYLFFHLYFYVFIQ